MKQQVSFEILDFLYTFIIFIFLKLYYYHFLFCFFSDILRTDKIILRPKASVVLTTSEEDLGCN